MSLCNELNSFLLGFGGELEIRGGRSTGGVGKECALIRLMVAWGFQDLTIFNQATLAKQSWRIIHYPESLLAKVLRGRYFKIDNFLKVGLGHNPSYTWRSIIWGRDLFAKGYGWRIGNGFNVDAVKDPWIPREGSCKPIISPLICNIL